MSPTCPRRRQSHHCFPRVSGDEPGGYLQPGLTTVFSRVSGDEPTAPKGGVWHGQFSPCERG